MRALNKWLLFFASVLFLSIPLLMIWLQRTCDYGSQQWCMKNWSEIGAIGQVTFWPAILLFLTLLITLPFTLAVFENWKRFALFAIPVLVLATIISINIPTSSGIGGLIEQQFIMLTLFVLYAVYFCISVGIVIYTLWKNRYKKA